MFVKKLSFLVNTGVLQDLHTWPTRAGLHYTHVATISDLLLFLSSNACHTMRGRLISQFLIAGRDMVSALEVARD